MRAVRVHEPGGPEVLRIDDVPVPEPGPGHARVRVEAAGVNFIDVYHRSGRYPLPLPAVLGMEGAGVVDAVGADGTDVRAGDPVAFTGVLGCYADRVVVPIDKPVPVPNDVGLATAAAVLLQGITAHYLTHSTFELHSGHTALVLAAGGGVGHLLVQVAKLRGARVVGAVSGADKESVAREAGADEIVRYRDVALEEAVRDLTGGRGVDVVYDSVGADTFERSMACLRRRGMLVLYGQASGPVAPVDPRRLVDGGSLYLTRPGIPDYMADREELLWRTGDLFAWLRDGRLRVRIDRSWPLHDAAAAHRYMENGRTTGKVLLMTSG
jgi:NADPH:quinone reductase